MSYDNLSSISQNALKFYQQFTSEENNLYKELHVVAIFKVTG